jgi:hypothetical protein
MLRIGRNAANGARCDVTVGQLGLGVVVQEVACAHISNRPSGLGLESRTKALPDHMIFAKAAEKIVNSLLTDVNVFF